MDIVYRKRRLISDVRRQRAPASLRPMVQKEPPAIAPVADTAVTRIDGIRPERGVVGSAKAERLPLGVRARKLYRRSELLYRQIRRALIAFVPRMTPHKAFYFSLVGGVAFGIVSTALLFRFLDTSVLAERHDVAGSMAVATEIVSAPETGISPAVDATYDPEEDVFLEYFTEAAEEEYQSKVRELVKGYPIEAMLPYIFEKDRMVAAFLIGIAKKESNWGKRVPVLEGQDCFNYWGYRGVRRMMGTGGHTCFNSRKDAVETVARRIEKLAYSEKLNTPEKMILWKCGFSCAGHSRESVKKWISDVDMYFSDLNYE